MPPNANAPAADRGAADTSLAGDTRSSSTALDGLSTGSNQLPALAAEFGAGERRISTYRTSPLKRQRRTKSEIGALRDGLEAIVAADHPMTVRQIFYRAVVAGLVEKTEAEYKSTIARLLLEMRQSGQLPYTWIADSTRWMRKPRTYTGLADFIDSHQRAYRRDLWAGVDLYLEIWCEKNHWLASYTT